MTTGQGQSTTDRKTMRQWAASSPRSVTFTLFTTCGVSLNCYLCSFFEPYYNLLSKNPDADEVLLQQWLVSFLCCHIGTGRFAKLYTLSLYAAYENLQSRQDTRNSAWQKDGWDSTVYYTGRRMDTSLSSLLLK